MEGHLLMSQVELERKRVMEQVLDGRLTLVKASKLLRVSYRQAVRICNRFRREGAKGLVHRSRGRSSNRRYPEAFRHRVVQRYEARYQAFGLGPTLLAEKLEVEGLKVDHETLRRWLMAEGLWARKRKRTAHRSRRERKVHFGELVQMDGSHHGGFGPDRPKACLMEMVDDATGTMLGLMAEEETTEAAMRLVWMWIELFGVPQGLYTDKKSVFVTDREPTLEEQLADEKPLTAFGNACKELGIEILAAHSPQAKGRVERKHGVLQDRLVAELALAGVKTIAGANRLLQGGFMDTLNQKFSQTPLDPHNFHRPLPSSVALADIFCFEEDRTLANDWTIRHQNRYYQITAENKPLPKPKDKILVRTRLDGQILLLYRGRPLAFQALTPRQYKKVLPKPQPTRPEETNHARGRKSLPRRTNYRRLLAHTGTG